MNKNVGFVSFRIAGTDGVSLEIEKWADVLEDMGCHCFYLAGELDKPEEQCMLYEPLHFQHPVTRDIYNRCFSRHARPEELTGTSIPGARSSRKCFISSSRNSK